MAHSQDPSDYHRSGDIYFWTEANQEGQQQFVGVINMTMRGLDGSFMKPLTLILPTSHSRSDVAQNEAHALAMILGQTSAAKTLIETHQGIYRLPPTTP